MASSMLGAVCRWPVVLATAIADLQLQSNVVAFDLCGALFIISWNNSKCNLKPASLPRLQA